MTLSICRTNKKERALQTFASKLLPTDGWEHSEQPVTDSPLTSKLTYWKKLVKRNCCEHL